MKTEMKKAFEQISPSREGEERGLERLLKAARAPEISRKAARPRRMIAAAAAAVLTVSTAAGAAAIERHRRTSVGDYYGESAQERIAADTDFTPLVTENGNFRITVDQVLSDGRTAVVLVTAQWLGAPELALTRIQEAAPPEQGGPYENVYFGLQPVFTGENGERLEQGDYGNKSSGLKDGVYTARYQIFDIGSLKTVSMTFEDNSPLDRLQKAVKEQGLSDDGTDPRMEELQEQCSREMEESTLAEGLSLTLNVEKNLEPVRFVSEDGGELGVTPFCLYEYSMSRAEKEFSDNGKPILYSFTLKNSETGEERYVGTSYGLDLEDCSQQFLREYIDDLDSYDTLEAEYFGTVYRRTD